MTSLLILLIRIYQFILSPLLHTIVPLPHHCRFNPTCSQYAIQAISEHGPLQGLRRAASQLKRCHPFTKV